MNQKYAQTSPYGYYGTSFPTQGMQQVPPGLTYNPYAQAGGPLVQPGAPNVGMQNPADFVPGMLPLEQSYIENILRLNKGKLATVYMTFENNREVFKGIVEAAGRDHIILSDPQTGMRYLLLMVYLNYITFDEELAYEYPFGSASAAQPITTYSPR
ncbi:spore coat protein GerQ [Bacillus suaedaesalsae]|uniref:Spore coat protein GerQ n=1 Tax=Bacillus suaedaesalsae TaxID=2810349 RepID=A0ABS2DGZ9_9BACI|nr:spore coat protein GerQ [Bacillus suaedaesalsae]MBM6616813.1 spore coat protein GerQ [Bacillus suaedaesalsae]